MKLTDEQIKQITDLANDEAFMKEQEPHVCWHLSVDNSMTRRILVAYERITGKSNEP